MFVKPGESGAVGFEISAAVAVPSS